MKRPTQLRRVSNDLAGSVATRFLLEPDLEGYECVADVVSVKRFSMTEIMVSLAKPSGRIGAFSAARLLMTGFARSAASRCAIALATAALAAGPAPSQSDDHHALRAFQSYVLRPWVPPVPMTGPDREEQSRRVVDRICHRHATAVEHLPTGSVLKGFRLDSIVELYRVRLLDDRAIDVLAEFDTSERKRYEIFIDPASGRMKMRHYLGKLSRDDVHRIMLHLASHIISDYLASGEKADPNRRCDIGPVS